MLVRIAIAFLLVAPLVSPILQAQEATGSPSVTLEAYRAGVRVLEASRDSLAAKNRTPHVLNELTVWYTLSRLRRFQGRSPEPPFDTLPSTGRVAFDEPKGRIALEFRARWPDFVRHVKQVATPSGGAIRDFNRGSLRAAPDLTSDQLSSLRRRIPHLMVRDGLIDRASVRLLRRASVGGEEAEVVSYRQPDGTPATLYVAKDDRTILAHETLSEDLRFGDGVRRHRYRDYADIGGVFLPRRIDIEEGGLTVALLRVDSASVDPADLAQATAVLDSVERSPLAADQREGTNPDASAASTAIVDTLRAGVYLVAPRQTPNYRILFVDLGGRLAAVEAPGSPVATRAAILAIREAVGPLPVEFAAITHHHADHAGGLSAFADVGATILTTPGNVAYVRDVLTAPRTLEARDPAPGRTVDIETVRGSRRLEGDLNDLLLHDVGPNAHVDEHLVATVPSAGLVFQGDLVQFPAQGGVEPARPQTRSLMEFIESLPWEVQTIVGVHGRAGTVENLRAALELNRSDAF